MKKIIVLGLAISAVFVAIQFVYRPSGTSLLNQTAETGPVLKKIVVGKTPLEVEVVNTPEKITLGLSGRAAIGSQGMLFVLPERQRPFFWMKEMKIGLDFIWIDGAQVVDITENVSAPVLGTLESELPTYQPKVPVTHVLEVLAGSISQWQIAVGDQVQIY